ncbi:ABC transporter substrate-binding protein [Neobacillus sp. Marseille-QA0830]
MVKTKRLFLSLLSFCIVLFMAACQDSSSTTTSKSNSNNETSSKGEKKSVSIGITVAPGSFNPIDRNDFATLNITNLLFNPLMDLDENFNYVPLLAESIETTDNQTFTVKLNPKAKWTDGNPVTSEDVMFTLEMISHPKVSSLFASNFSILQGLSNTGKLESGSFADLPGAKAVDDHTIVFKTKNPVDMMAFHEKISFNLKAMPKHILKDVDPEKLQQNEFMQNPTVSYGAFKFVSYQKNQYVELAANKDYFRGTPKLDQLFFKIMPAANLVAQLQSGEIDMNYPEIGAIAVQDFEKVKSLKNVTTKEGIPLNDKFIAINNSKVSDTRVRQAFAYGINRKLMVDNLLKGAGQVGNVPYAPVHPYYNKALENKYPYDAAKAKELLKDAGWDKNKVLNFIVPTGDALMEQAANIITENLGEIGVKAEIQKLDTASAVQKLRSGDYDICIWNNRFKLDPDVTQLFGTGASINLTKFSNPDADKALANGLATTDPKERKKYYYEFQEIFAEELPQITLYLDKRLRAVNKRVVVGEPKDIGMLLNVQDWDVK